MRFAIVVAISLTAVSMAATQINGAPEKSITCDPNLTEAQESTSLAERVRAIPDVELPDEWYQSNETDLTARLDRTLEIARSSDHMNEAALQALRERIVHSGEVYAHRIFFNRPMPPCVDCGNTVGDGLVTVVSFRAGDFLAIPLRKLHDVEEHDGCFVDSERNRLRIILAD